MIGLTLGRYFSAGFLTLIMAVFITISGMIFVVDSSKCCAAQAI